MERTDLNGVTDEEHSANLAKLRAMSESEKAELIWEHLRKSLAPHSFVQRRLPPDLRQIRALQWYEWGNTYWKPGQTMRDKD